MKINPPYHTKIDKIINKASPHHGHHYGSIITRKIIKKYQPLLCEAGHTHEHFTKIKLGRTTRLNSGFVLMSIFSLR